MNINTKNLLSMTEANRNFSKVARLVDENGSVVILKNNAPKYVVLEFKEVENAQYMADEDLLSISKRIIDENLPALEELAK